MDTDTDTWKERPKQVRWFSLHERMGVCPSIKPKEEREQEIAIAVKPANAYPFKDYISKLNIRCAHHGGTDSGREINTMASPSFSSDTIQSLKSMKSDQSNVN